MPDINEIHPYNFPASQANDFERKGHPGRFLKTIECSPGTTTFTGSNYGQGGLIVPNGASGTAYFSAGGSVPLSVLSGSQRILEFSLFSVTVNAGTVYALIKNQLSK
jgi:hypothetical protein